MSQALVEQALQEYMDTQWVTTPVVYENVEEKGWTLPGQPLLPTGKNDYIHVKIETYSSQAITVPAVCRRDRGGVEVTVFVREETGSRKLKQYLDSLVSLLEYKEFSAGDTGLRVQQVVSQMTYATDDGWYVGRITFSMFFNRHVIP